MKKSIYVIQRKNYNNTWEMCCEYPKTKSGKTECEHDIGVYRAAEPNAEFRITTEEVDAE